MAFDHEAWKKALRDGTAPKYQYKGIAGAYDMFANALIAHEPFMEHFANTVIDDLIDAFKRGDEQIREAWIKHVQSVAEQEAIRRDNRLGDRDPEGGHYLYEEIKENMTRNRHQLREWLRVRVLENYSDLQESVRTKVRENDEDAQAWRSYHPPEGVWSRRHKYCYPFSALVGFCPRCHEPLPKDSISQAVELGGAWVMQCPECRLNGSIDWNVQQFGHRADVLPFTDVTLKSVIEESKRYRSQVYANA